MDNKFIKPHFSTIGLAARYKLWAGITTVDQLFDYSLGGKPGTATGTDIAPNYPGFSFNGSDDFIDIGNQASAIKTIAMWVKATSIGGNDYPIDLNGTDYISIETGTVTGNGFGGAEVIYVDGVSGSTVSAGTWHLIVMSHAVAKTASDLDIGRVEGVGLFTGLIGEVMLFDSLLAANEVLSLFELTRWRYGV